MSREKKNRVAQLRSRKRLHRNVSRKILQAMAWIGVAVLYYALLSLIFDTPYESYLKDSSERLRSEYVALHDRYDSLEMVVANIEQRDGNIYNILFESTPEEFDDGHLSQRFDIYDKMRKSTTVDLARDLDRSIESLEQSVTAVVESTLAMCDDIETRGSKSCQHIPSIQPIVNRDLTLLTASYGVRMNPFYKTMYLHRGVDYTIAEGTRVFATADGVIKNYSLKSSASGKSVTIDHGDGYETYYAHLSRIDIPRSRRVKRGDIIGMSGSTGLSLTPHLHYEVRYRGERVNPIDYLFMELNPQRYDRMREIAERGMQAFD